MGSPDFTDGCMVALYPPRALAEALAVDGGLPPEDMHVTVAYCGDAVDVDPEILRPVVEALADRPPIDAQVSGLARFTGGDQDVLVALVDSPGLEDLRRDLMDALTSAGVAVPRDHGFAAHCTLTYLAPDEPAHLDRLPAQRVRFGALSVVHGTDRTDYRFDPDREVKAAAREAFAAGWAVSGGPMTERVKAACEVAIALAVENADDPGIFKATVDLGRLEGTWALLFQRREALQEQHTAAVARVWRRLLAQADLASGVRRFRWQYGLTEAGTDDRGRNIKAAATAAALAMLRALAGLPGWQDLRDALRDAVRASRAEGMVDAVALAAGRADAAGLDWDAAFQQAYDSLEDLDELAGDADGWLGRLVDRAAASLALVLTGEAADDADAEDAEDAAGSEDATGFVVDWAMTTAAAAGALSLYQAHGASGVDIVTVGDGRVCAACWEAEAGSPWAPGEVPLLPLHPMCRCSYAADVDLGLFAAWFT